MALDTYTKLGFINNSKPSVNATNLNHMDDAIEANRNTLIDHETLKPHHATKTVAAADPVTNTDSAILAAGYPYMLDVSIASVTADTLAIVNPATASDVAVFLACCDGSNQTMTGVVRVYFTAKPTASVTLDIAFGLREAVMAA
jgi:hypothetical protein